MGIRYSRRNMCSTIGNNHSRIYLKIKGICYVWLATHIQILKCISNQTQHLTKDWISLSNKKKFRAIPEWSNVSNQTQWKFNSSSIITFFLFLSYSSSRKHVTSLVHQNFKKKTFSFLLLSLDATNRSNSINDHLLLVFLGERQ